MKLITNKSIKRKILIAMLIIIIASFMFPVKAQASIGGKLLEPVIDLVVALGDGAYGMAHRFIMSQEDTLIRVDLDGAWEGFWTAFTAIFTALAIVGISICTGGIATAVAAGGLTAILSIGGTAVFAITGGAVAGYVFNSAFYGDEVVLPLYSIAPENIFSGKIPLFDVDFFNTEWNTVESGYGDVTFYNVDSEYDSWEVTREVDDLDDMGEYINDAIDEMAQNLQTIFQGYDTDTIKENYLSYSSLDGQGYINGDQLLVGTYEKYYVFSNRFYIDFGVGPAGTTSALIVDSESIEKEIQEIQESSDYTYEEKIDMLNDNNYYYLGVVIFVRENEVTIHVEDGKTQFNVNYVGQLSIAYELKDTIASWYVSIRNIVIVGMMSVLVYVGIRILLSSTSGDKAKYKQFLIDWIVAMCLVFIMHYIMSFSNTIVKQVTQMVNSTDENMYMLTVADDDGKITEYLTEELGYSEDDIDYYTDENGNVVEDDNGDKYILWQTNSLGASRFYASYARNKDEHYAGYALMFIVMVFFTIFFIFTYLKRIIYMAFLTLMAPLVALTYPIDKMNDGKAQAFNMWLKEYIFNLLIQPMHLLLYTILVTSAFELASTNIIYSLVAIGFMIPAEKLLRRFFGFEKAQTPGMLGGAAGAALTMSALSKGLGRLAHGPKGKDGEKGETSSNDGDSSIKYSDKLDSMGTLLTNGDSSQASTTNNNMGGTPQVRTQDVSNNEVGNNTERANRPINETPSGIVLPDSYVQRQQQEEAARNRQEREEAERVRQQQEARTNNRKLSKPSRLRALSTGTRYYAHGMKNKMKNKHVGRRAIRFAGGLALGGAAGMMGLAAGITSGDPSKALQYTVTGASGGYLAGKGVVNTAARIPGAAKDTFGVEGTVQAIDEAYYGKDEYENRRIQENIRNNMNDYEIKHELERILKDKEKVERAQREVIPYATQYGMGNVKDIGAISEYMEKTGVSAEESTAIIKEVKSYGKSTSKLGQKDHDDLEKTLRRRIRNKIPNATEQDVNNHAARIRQAMNKASDIYYK